MFSLTDEIRLNHAASVKTAPTVCRYFDLDETGRVRTYSVWYAWDNQTDRRGDGEAEAEAFVEASRENGFTVTELTGEMPVGPGLPENIPSDSLRVYRADDGGGYVQYFALAVIPADGYWDHETRQWVEVGA